MESGGVNGEAVVGRVGVLGKMDPGSSDGISTVSGGNGGRCWWDGGSALAMLSMKARPISEAGPLSPPINWSMLNADSLEDGALLEKLLAVGVAAAGI